MKPDPPIRAGAPAEPHLVFFERAGDACAAYHRATKGEAEFYFGERRTVEAKRALARRFGRATVITALGDHAWDEPLDARLRSVGLGAVRATLVQQALRRLEADPPTHLIVGPELPVLEWAAERGGIEVLPNFAHTFFNPPAEPDPCRRAWRRAAGWRQRRRFRAVLRRLDPKMLLNHNRVATEDLRRLAPRPERVHAFEVIDESPLERARARTLPTEGLPTVFYCGRVSREKGVHDLVRACGLLAGRGLAVRLTVCGSGDEAGLRSVAASSGLGSGLDWRGPTPRREVVRLMDQAAVAAVPSWSSYPEGLPLTLMEPLGFGVPLVASDHRSWSRLRESEQVVTHRSARPGELAAALERVLTSPTLYERLSLGGPVGFRSLLGAVPLAELQHRWAEEVLGTDPGPV